jgi:hypothetical protein
MSTLESSGSYIVSRCEGPAYSLGRIFFHRSDLEAGLREARPKTRLEFNLVPGRDPGTLRALKVGHDQAFPLLGERQLFLSDVKILFPS